MYLEAANGEQAARCEAAGILPHMPVKRAVNNKGGSTLFSGEQFRYQPETDTYLCPANKIIQRKQLNRHDKAIIYRADSADCSCCSIKGRCTQTSARILTRLLDENALIDTSTQDLLCSDLQFSGLVGRDTRVLTEVHVLFRAIEAVAPKPNFPPDG